MVIKGYDVGAALKKTAKEISEDKISVYAGQMAYAMFFSLFPLLLFFAALLSLVGDRSTVEGWFNSRLAAALPSDVSGLLATTIEKVIFSKGAPGLLSFGILTAAWAGSGVFGALRAALNAAYDVDETRPRWKQYGLQLGMLAIAGVVLLFATVILLNGEGVMAWLGRQLRLGSVTTLVWTVAQYPLAVGALVAVIWLIYYLLPNCRGQDKGILLVGSLIATTFWMAATLLFRLYVQQFNRMNPAYGAVGAIMVLLTWMYYSAFVLLAVGELIAILEKGAGRQGAAPRAADLASHEPVPRQRALVPAAATGRPPEPRWAARMSARRDGDGRGVLSRALRRIPPFRVVDRVSRGVTFARDWVEGTIAHLRADVAIARREVGEIVQRIGVGSALVGIGGVLAFVGAVTLLTGIILLIGDQWIPSDLYWLAALILSVAAGVTAFAVGRAGRRLTREGITPPRQTVETLREDKAVLVDALRGGG